MSEKRGLSAVAPITTAAIQRAGIKSVPTDPAGRDVGTGPANAAGGDGPLHPPPRNIIFSAGELCFSSRGTGFLIDDMGGRLVARGFQESDTWNRLFGNAAASTIRADAAFGVLDGYEVMESGAFIGALYGVGSYWLIEGGRARGIVSGEAFGRYHFSSDNVQWVPESLILSLQRDENLFIRDSALQKVWTNPDFPG